MITRTALANRALAHLGEEGISDIDDTTSAKARICKEFTGDVIDEVLRLHRWNCAIERTTLSRLAEPPDHGYAHAYQLPEDFIRLLELNGEQFDGSAEFLEIEAGQRLLTDDDTAEIRYVKRIDVHEFDPLLGKAVALALAVEIAIPLTKDSRKREALEGAFLRAIGRAAKIDALETGARENRPLSRLFANSRLIASRGHRANADPLRYRLP
jgi:hypothetical protein